MKRILITGGSGFIGSNLVEYYLAQPEVQVRNFDALPPRNPAQVSCWEKLDFASATEAIIADRLREFSPHYIFHLAARTDLDGQRIEDYSANTEGVARLMAACQDLPDLQRIAFASSRLVCEIGYQPVDEQDYCPTTIYGESKVIGERLVKAQSDNLPEWFIFRPTSIWGPWFGVPYLNFFLTVNKKLYLHPVGKSIYKSFGFVRNSVYQLDRLMFAPAAKVHKKMFYLCDYPPLELSAWATLIADKMQVSRPKKVPVLLLALAARAGDLLKMLGWENPPLTSFRLNNLLTDMTHDTRALQEICGELPYSLETGVEETVSWLKLHHYID